MTEISDPRTACTHFEDSLPSLCGEHGRIRGAFQLPAAPRAANGIARKGPVARGSVG